jgi:hypothetical protein
MNGPPPQGKVDEAALLRGLQQQMLGGQVPKYPSINELMNAAQVFRDQQQQKGT